METIDRPIPSAKACKVKEMPAAAIAPAKIAGHWKWELRSGTATSATEVITAYQRKKGSP